MLRPPAWHQTVTLGELWQSMSEPGWVTHAVWWQIYPLGFVGAPTTAATDTQSPESASADASGSASGGAAAVGAGAAGAGAASPRDAHRLTRIIDWLDYVIELGASGIALGPIFASESHGYDTVDYFTIDARLGDETDFARLVDEAHSRGLRVLLDGVFNHVGRGFGPLQRALAGGADAPERAWFVPLGADGAADAGGADAESAAGHPRFEVFEGHDALVTLNHRAPEVADFVVSVMTYWLDRGADGWRLDAAYAVDPAFWASVLPRVRAVHPKTYIFGEVLHGDYSAIVEEATLDSVTQYEVWKAIWSSIHDANFFELAHALERHNGFLEHFVPVTFVGNHDVTRLATAVDDRRHLAHALVVLLTIGGTPTIYYGDEQGYLGLKEQRVGGDDAIRPEYPAAGPSALADEGWPVYRLHQNLIGLRRRHAWVHSARTAPLKLTNEFFAYEVVDSSGDAARRLVVLLNLADDPYEFEVAGASTVVAGDAALTPTAAGVSVITPPHGWAVLEG
jgi:cyclomaltodextrinase